MFGGPEGGGARERTGSGAELAEVDPTAVTKAPLESLRPGVAPDTLELPDGSKLPDDTSLPSYASNIRRFLNIGHVTAEALEGLQTHLETWRNEQTITILGFKFGEPTTEFNQTMKLIELTKFKLLPDAPLDIMRHLTQETPDFQSLAASIGTGNFSLAHLEAIKKAADFAYEEKKSRRGFLERMGLFGKNFDLVTAAHDGLMGGVAAKEKELHGKARAERATRLQEYQAAYEKEHGNALGELNRDMETMTAEALSNLQSANEAPLKHLDAIMALTRDDVKLLSKEARNNIQTYLEIALERPDGMADLVGGFIPDDQSEQDIRKMQAGLLESIEDPIQQQLDMIKGVGAPSPRAGWL